VRLALCNDLRHGFANGAKAGYRDIPTFHFNLALFCEQHAQVGKGFEFQGLPLVQMQQGTEVSYGNAMAINPGFAAGDS
jgi:hypothetical protein